MSLSDLEIDAAGDVAVKRAARIAELEAEVARLRGAITTADLQIGDGHIGNARKTLHAAMDTK